MHKYKIEILNLDDNGSVLDTYKVEYADDEERAELVVNAYVNKKRSVLNENEEVVREVNAYKVNLYVMVYKMITDKSAFFRNFKA